jgi:A/G-specific adenine glycosylase
MDLGAMVCTARMPACQRCPVARQCNWFANGDSAPAVTALASPNPKFETTARFARGRIVEQLRRQGPSTVESIAAALPAVHADRLGKYLEGLANDGLVEISGDTVALPGDATTAE